MCYTNGRCSVFSHDSNLECQSEDEIIEENKCTTVMISKQKSYH
ncbi:hypothetical protein [Candidatus Ichthyocystis sparus]|nr:hypothetical protein [Candidatus Ichthyocystis sparus]